MLVLHRSKMLALLQMCSNREATRAQTLARWRCAAIAAVVLVADPVLAQELTGTLKKIRDTGVITLGHREVFRTVLLLR